MNVTRLYFFILLFSVSIFSAGSISDIESSMHDTSHSNSSDSSASISTSSSNSSNNSKGGYQENTTVVGVEELLDRTSFSVNDFDRWISMYVRAKEVELFLSLYRNGAIDAQGVALQHVQFGRIVFAPGTVILPSKFEPYVKEHFTSIDLYGLLQNQAILDHDGFLLDYPEGKTIFNREDFDALRQNIRLLPLDISDAQMKEDLLNQLYEYLVSQQHVKQITSVTTTDYISRENDFLNQIAMQFVGSFVGKHLFKDKTNVSNHKVDWVPHMDVSTYLNNFYIGFNDYPFKYGSKSKWLWNGALNQAVIEFDYLEDAPISQYLIAAKKQYLFGTKDVLGRFRKSHMYAQVYTRNHLLQDGTDSLNIYTVGVGAGGSMSYKNNIEMGLGLAVNDGSTLSLGFSTFFGWEWLPFRPLSVSLLGAYYSQPSSTNTVWSFSEVEAAFKVHLPYLAIKTGYRRLGSDSGTLTEGVFTGITASF